MPQSLTKLKRVVSYQSMAHGGFPHSSHDHSHSHGKHHAKGADGSGAAGRIRWAFWLNLSFAIVEVVGGILSRSVAVSSSAIHDLGDSLAIGLAYFLEVKSNSPGKGRYSYGYRRLSALAGLITGFFVMLSSVAIMVVSLYRFWSLEEPNTPLMLGFATLGILVNGAAAMRLLGGKGHNEQMLKWHLVQDLLGWILVLISAGLIHFLHWSWLDPLAALGLAAWILWNVMRGSLEAAQVFLQVTPLGLETLEVEQFILDHFKELANCHHTHLWTLDGESHILTSHLLLKAGVSVLDFPAMRFRLKEKLREKFRIVEATFEVEMSGETCEDPIHTVR